MYIPGQQSTRYPNAPRSNQLGYCGGFFGEWAISGIVYDDRTAVWSRRNSVGCGYFLATRKAPKNQLILGVAAAKATGNTRVI